MRDFVGKLANYPRGMLALSALLFALPFSVSSLWFLSYFAAVPLYFVLFQTLPESGPKRCFALGFWFGFCYHLLIYTWFFAFYPFEVAKLSKVAAAFLCLLAYVGASAIHALFFSLSFWVYGLLSRGGRTKPYARALLFACLFLLSEALCDVGTLALPWSRIGLPQAAFPLGIQLASVIGPYGIDFLLLAFGAFVYFALRAKRVREGVVSITLALCVLLCNFGYGVYRTLLKEEEAKTIRVGIVQTNVPSGEKWEITRDELEETCAGLCLSETLSDADIIVFPETVLASSFSAAEGRYFTGLSEETGAALVAGSIYEDAGKTYNAALLFDENGLQSYGAKRHLVPFGEYLPWKGFLSVVLPSVANMTYYRSEYSEGESGLLGVSDGVTLGALVCFDTLFPTLCAESVREGAEILIAVTNDSWFKDSAALEQHLWQGVYRAVETHRPFVQSANAGISAVTDANGRVLVRGGVQTEEVLSARVSLSQEQTLYTRFGNVVFYGCGVVVLAALLVRVWRVGKGKRRHE